MGGMQPLLIFMNKKLNERANDRADFISKFELKLMRVTIWLEVFGFLKNLLIDPLFRMKMKELFLLTLKFSYCAIHPSLLIFIFFPYPHATSSGTLLHKVNLRYLEEPVYSFHQITHCRGRSHGCNWITSNLTARIAERSKEGLNFIRSELWRYFNIWSKELYKLEN